MAVSIDRLLDGGIVELKDAAGTEPWRGTKAPGDDLGDLSAEMQAAINAHWSEDVGGVTRAERFAQQQAEAANG